MGAVGKTYGFVPPEGARKYLSVIARGTAEDDVTAKRSVETEDVRLNIQDVDRKKRKSESDSSAKDLNHLKTSEEPETSEET